MLFMTLRFEQLSPKNRVKIPVKIQLTDKVEQGYFHRWFRPNGAVGGVCLHDWHASFITTGQV